MTTITNITAAGLLGVSTRTINRLVQNGTIQAPSPRRGQRTMIPASELQRFLQPRSYKHAWTQNSACQGVTPLFDTVEITTPTRISSTGLRLRIKREKQQHAEALNLCASCPVRRECLQAAVNHETWTGYTGKQLSPAWISSRVFGIHGETTPTERVAHYWAFSNKIKPHKQARTTAFKYLDAYNNPVLTRILKEANQ